MEQQWRIRIRGKQRASVDVRVLVRAVLALGRQLQAEAAAPDADATPKAAEQPIAEGTSATTETVV